MPASSGHWPGNVRELRNAIERAAIVARGREIHPEHLPPPADPQPRSASLGTDREEIQNLITRWIESELRQPDASTADSTLYNCFLALVEPPLLQSILHRNQGNRASAALQIGIHRATLRQKLRKCGIE